VPDSTHVSKGVFTDPAHTLVESAQAVEPEVRLLQQEASGSLVCLSLASGRWAHADNFDREAVPPICVA
jgi:hypothetical protein